MSSPSSLFSATSTQISLDTTDLNDGATGQDTCSRHDRLDPPQNDSEIRDEGVCTNGDIPSASWAGPPIPGLYVFPGLLPADIAQDALRGIAEADHFHGGARDQVMLFTAPPSSTSTATLPQHLENLLHSLSTQLRELLPPDVHRTVFSQPLARQAILNLYPPGQGITPHIDLSHRYADGILGMSLIGGTVMDFTHPVKGVHSVYLPPRSVYILSGEARWGWKHGIAGRDRDVVDGVTILRDLRASVTFRWMKEGGDVLS